MRSFILLGLAACLFLSVRWVILANVGTHVSLPHRENLIGTLAFLTLVVGGLLTLNN